MRPGKLLWLSVLLAPVALVLINLTLALLNAPDDLAILGGVALGFATLSLIGWLLNPLVPWVYKHGRRLNLL